MKVSPLCMGCMFFGAKTPEKEASEKGVSMSQMALAWVMSRPGVTTPIIGSRTMDQLKDNLKALDVEITDGDSSAIDDVVPPGTAVREFYSADWGPHAHRVLY